MPLIFRPIADGLRRSRALWGGLCWVLAAAMMVFGVTYGIYGIHATSNPAAFAAVTSLVPGGMRTYGVLMTALGYGLLHGMLPVLHRRRMYDRWLIAVLGTAAAFCACVAAAFVTSWLLTGALTWAGVAYWGSLGAVAGLAWAFPPASGPPRVAG